MERLAGELLMLCEKTNVFKTHLGSAMISNTLKNI